MLKLRWLLGVLLTGALSQGTAAAVLSCTANPSSSVERVLRGVVGGEPVPAGFSVTYTELQPPHASLSLSIHADGTVAQQAVGEPVGQPRAVTPWEWRKLAALIVVRKLWQQQTPERAPGNDEGRATLTLRCGEQVSEVWEWQGDLAKNRRLIQVREAMKKAAWTP